MSFVRVPRPEADGVRRYGAQQWPEDPKRCRAERSVGEFTSQCRRPRHHGPDGAFCFQHAKDFKREARKA
jgi:hypothetical protein